MKGLVALLTVTCACNQVFGVDGTGLVDAPPPIDAAVDAPPPSCPTDGSVPVFKNELVNVPARYCTYYSVSEALGEAAALCATEGGSWAGNSMVGAGPMDGPLVEQVLDPPPTAGAGGTFAFAHEGHQILMTYYEYNLDGSYGYKTLEYTRSGTGWTLAKSYSMDPTGQYYLLSTASVGPDRRAMLYRMDTATQIYVMDEVHQPAGSWTTKDTYTLAQLGVSQPTEMTLSADGLRLLIATYEARETAGGGTGSGGTGTEPSPPESNMIEKAIFYTSRSSLGERFGAARRLTSVPEGVHSPYMTENCGRIYFSALNSVWYLRQ